MSAVLGFLLGSGCGFLVAFISHKKKDALIAALKQELAQLRSKLHLS